MIWVSVQKVHHVDALFNVLDQLHVQKQCCYESADVYLDVRSIYCEVFLIKDHCFDDQPGKSKLDTENPQARVEVATELLIVNLVLLNNFFCITEVSHCIEIFGQVDLLADVVISFPKTTAVTQFRHRRVMRAVICTKAQRSIAETSRANLKLVFRTCCLFTFSAFVLVSLVPDIRQSAFISDFIFILLIRFYWINFGGSYGLLGKTFVYCRWFYFGLH